MLSQFGTDAGRAPRPQASRLVLARPARFGRVPRRASTRLPDAAGRSRLIDAFYDPLIARGVDPRGARRVTTMLAEAA